MSPITSWEIRGVGDDIPGQERPYRETIRERATQPGQGFESAFNERCNEVLDDYAGQLQQERYSMGAILKTAAVGVAIDIITFPVGWIPGVRKAAEHLAGPKILEAMGVDPNIRTSARAAGLLPGINPMVVEAGLRARDKLWGEATVNVPSIRIKTNPGPKVYG